jgi:alcohol dehydrogenase class IV
MNFGYLMPTRIVFGRGKLNDLGALAAPFGQSALVVTGRRSARQSGALQQVCDSLAAAGLAVHVFDGVSANPRSDEVDAAVALARRGGCDLVVGLGGGSALDAAKAIAVCLDFASVRELIGKNVPDGARTLPIIAIPTTAGTGSEVTRGAIIQDAVTGFKSGVRGDALFPRLAIVDPELSASMAATVALETAFDAFTHAVESYVCRAATPITDALSEQAIQLVAQHWHQLTQSPVPPGAHDALCLAAVLGGINVGNTGTCLPHRLQQAMASVTRLHVSHGRGLAAVYPAWLRKACPHAPARFSRVASLLGGHGASDPVHEITALIEVMGLPSDVSALGFVAADIDTVCASISGNVANDPIAGLDDSVIRTLFESAMVSRQESLANA